MANTELEIFAQGILRPLNSLIMSQFVRGRLFDCDSPHAYRR